MANMIMAIKVLASYSISLLKYYCWYWKATKIIHSNSLNKEIIIDENFRMIIVVTVSAAYLAVALIWRFSKSHKCCQIKCMPFRL